jgi:WD40 repeat protein
MVSPSSPNYFINSVALSADGSRVVGGTFYHKYGTTSSRQTEDPAQDNGDGQTGTFGTYCYNQDGKLLWKDEFTGWQGTYWVDISRDGAFAASGGWYSNNPYAGFVRAYDVSSGKTLLDFKTSGRVNQVALSADGTWLVSAAETLVLFKRGTDNTYSQTYVFNPGGTKNPVETAAISADGKRIVCGDYNGYLYIFDNNAGTLVQLTKWQQSAYSHSIRLTPDGTAFVAGAPSGYVNFFDIAQLIQTGKPTASYQCSSKSAVYGVALADDASAFVGVSNVGTDGGLVCLVKRAGTQATLLWQAQLPRNPNCASLNLAHNLLAIADGHPNDTPGHFSLFDTKTGNLLWQYTTTTNMSWPIMISQDGNAIAAGSDDSHIYYFVP